MHEDRPIHAQPGKLVSADLYNAASSTVSTLFINVDHREEYPNSTEIQGTTNYFGNRYRATIILNHNQPELDSVTLVLHP